MWHSALTASLLLASQVSAGVLGDGTMEQKMRRFVDSIVDPIERRQSTTSTTNVTQWNAQTIASCTTALGALNGNASNPSGMAACYNIAYLEKSTGVFQADLQLFTISPPSGSFANIPSQNVMVKLQYSGAAVSAVNASSLMRRADAVSPISRPQSVDEMEKRQAAVPTIAQSYTFVGQINKNLLTSTTTIAAYEKILVPVVTLTGVDPSGNIVNTTLSSSEATFVNGVFAQAVVTAQPPLQTLVVAANAPFVVPGLHILIFPIGGIITGIWAVLFIGTITYGTVRRTQFREQFRRRVARTAKGDLARI